MNPETELELSNRLMAVRVRQHEVATVLKEKQDLEARYRHANAKLWDSESALKNEIRMLSEDFSKQDIAEFLRAHWVYRGMGLI